MILKLFLAFGSGFIGKLSKFAKQCYVYRRIKKIWLFENLGIALASWYDFDILITVRIISIFFFTRIRIGSSFNFTSSNMFPLSVMNTVPCFYVNIVKNTIHLCKKYLYKKLHSFIPHCYISTATNSTIPTMPKTK